MGFIAKFAWIALPAFAGCGVLSQVSSQGTGTNQDGKAKRSMQPVGAKQAFDVDVTYRIDAGKAAREAGGNVYLVQKVPPSMRAGTSPNQDITSSFTLDGQQPKIMKSERGDDLFVLKANSNSGTAVFSIKGIVYNRDLTNPSGQKTPLSASERKRYLEDSKYIKPSDPKVQSAIDSLGLRKRSGESDRAFADRVGVWIAKNKKYTLDESVGGAPRDENNPQSILYKPGLNCNGASALWATVLQGNNIPTQIRLRLITRIDNNPEKWTFHADVMPYLDGEWVGINSTGPMSGPGRIVQRNTMRGDSGFLTDMGRYGGPLIDIATIAGDRIKLDGIGRFYSTFNTHLPRIYVPDGGAGRAHQYNLIVAHNVREIPLDGSN